LVYSKHLRPAWDAQLGAAGSGYDSGR